MKEWTQPNNFPCNYLSLAADFMQHISASSFVAVGKS
jgi:hypothetical protein